jgi:uncharacterized membrane protein YccC
MTVSDSRRVGRTHALRGKLLPAALEPHIRNRPKQREISEHAAVMRLSIALPQAAALPTVLDAVPERGARRAATAEELVTLHSDTTAALDQIEELLPEARRRLQEGRAGTRQNLRREARLRERARRALG